MDDAKTVRRIGPLLAAALILVSMAPLGLAQHPGEFRTPYPRDIRPSGPSDIQEGTGLRSQAGICGDREPHPPIHIEHDAQFGLPGSGVTQGEGTPEDPYVIEGWCILGPGRTVISEGISIRSTSAHFVVRDNLVRGFFLGMTLTFLSHGAVDGNVLEANHQALSLWGTDRIPVSGNEVLNATYGLFVRGDSHHNRISNNTFDGPSTAVGAALSVEGNDNTIRDNVVTANEYGIRIAGSATDNTIRGNNIHGTDVGLRGEAAGTVDAENNWWGCPDGPDDPDCDDVEGDVDYDPWLTSPNPEAGSDGG